MSLEALRRGDVKGFFHALTTQGKEEQRVQRLKAEFEAGKHTFIEAFNPHKEEIVNNGKRITYLYEKQDGKYKEIMYASLKYYDTIQITYSRYFQDMEYFDHDENKYAIDVTHGNVTNFRSLEHSKIIYVERDAGLLPVDFPFDSETDKLKKKIRILTEISSRLSGSDED